MNGNKNTVIYLSPNGKANAPGTMEEPMSTLRGAIARLNRLDSQGELYLPAEIVLLDGIYRLDKTLEISTAFPLTIRGANPGKAILDGSLPIEEWQAVSINGRRAFQCHVPIPVLQLYCHGKPMTRAAFPKHNQFYHVGDERHPWESLFAGSDFFSAAEGSFDANWHHPQGIEVLLHHKWMEEHLPVKCFDTAKNQVQLTIRSTSVISKEDTEYRFENVREALLEPGEFYYDSTEGTLAFIPPEGEDVPEDCAIPLVGQLLRVKDSQYLTLCNLTFRHAGAYRPRFTSKYDLPDAEIPNHAAKPHWIKGEPWGCAPQAAVQLPGTVFAQDSHHCHIHHCEFVASEWHALEISEGCHNIRIERNDFHHLGGGGIRIGGAPLGEAPQKSTHRITVLNNHIHDVGLTYWSAVGILVVHAYGNLIEHNHIHHLKYSGISAGWVWGFAQSITCENRIGWNHIHHLGEGLLSDMGGIYLLGIQPGTRVYNNLIHNVKRRYYGGWGIYTDEGSSHITVENNVVYDCSSEAYHQHYGRENTLRFNIFACGGDAVFALSRGKEPNFNYFPGENFNNALSIYNNLFISVGTPFLRPGSMELFTLPTFMAEGNIFHYAGSDSTIPPIAACNEEKLDLQQWQALGFDKSGIMADPGCRDIAKRDFTFSEESLLAQRHFQSLDINAVGIQPQE